MKIAIQVTKQIYRNTKPLQLLLSLASSSTPKPSLFRSLFLLLFVFLLLLLLFLAFFTSLRVFLSIHEGRKIGFGVRQFFLFSTCHDLGLLQGCLSLRTGLTSEMKER